MNILKSRRIEDMPAVCFVSLSCFGQAIKSKIIVSGHKTKYVNYKTGKALCCDIKPVCNAVNEENALKNLMKFEKIFLWQKIPLCY